MTVLVWVFVLCAVASGLLSVIRTRWSQVLSLLIGLFATGYGCLYELGIAAEHIQFSVYKANISFIWTGIARVLWPTVLVTLILVYLALFDLKEKHWIEQFVALSLIGSIGVFLVLTSRTYLSMFLAWEIMLWSGFFIVRLTTHEKDAVKASLVSNVFWSILFLVAVILLSAYGWDSSYGAVAEKLTSFNMPSVLGFLLLFLVFLSNMGVFPFHFSMERTLKSVDPVAAAYLSGATTKAGLFGMLSMSLFTGAEWLSHFGSLVSLPVGSLVIGGVVIAGAVYFTHKALKSDDYLTLLSYISSLQLSYVAIILPFMPMEVDYLPAAFIGTVMMAYAHSLSQTGLYVAAGWSTENSLSTEGEETKESVEQLPLWRRMPYTSVLSLISGLSATGLPPLIGFGALYMIYTAFFEMNLYVLPGLLLLVTLCLLLCTIKYLGGFLLVKKPSGIRERGIVSMLVSILTSVGILGLGVFNTSLQKLLSKPLKSLSEFFVFDFNTQTAAGSWNSLYVFAILIAAVLMAALVWSFGSSEEAGGSTNFNSEESSPDLPAADHDSDEFPKEGDNL